MSTPSECRERCVGLVALVCLCAVVSTRWSLEAVYPNTRSTRSTQFLAIGSAVLVYATLRQRRAGLVWADALPPSSAGVLCSLGALLALIGPLTPFVLSGGLVSTSSVVLSLVFVPLFLAVISSVQLDAKELELGKSLWPSLIGLAGALFLLPEPGGLHLRQWFALLSIPILTSSGAALTQNTCRVVRSGVMNPNVTLSKAFDIALALAFLLAFLAAFAQKTTIVFSTAGFAIDTVVCCLSLLLLSSGGALRWSAQFFLIPAFSLLQGIVVYHIPLSSRVVIGLGCLVFGVLRLTWIGSEKATSSGFLNLR